MYTVGQKEVDAVAKTILSRRLFRYKIGNQCSRFEQRYAKFLGVKHAVMTPSGTHALTAALVGLGIGPGDEVIVPCCTFMATAVSVLAAGAIPVLVDIDDTITMDPKALERIIGPRTRAVIPVHMWGLPCDMKAVMKIARRHKLLVIEDACQAVGGGYEGRMLGAIGQAGAFSFNYYKNMTCGEGGAVVTNDNTVFQRAFCATDCCNYYWKGGDVSQAHFISNGSRASELEGAMLNAQLDRLAGMIRKMRQQKHRILKASSATALVPIRHNSPDHECGTHVMFTLPTTRQADLFAAAAAGTVTGKTGRHVYTLWEPILQHRGGPHPAMNPYTFKENAPCRKDYSLDMCAGSLDILNRTVFIQTNPEYDRRQVDAMIRRIVRAADKVLR